MIAIVDYGLGNISAFANIFKRLNIEFLVSDSKVSLNKAKRIILPGVGSFDHAMNSLNLSGLRETLDDLVIHKGVPVLGVCVGMQMMADQSEEGVAEGLGWIPGTVRLLKSDLKGRGQLVLPHMGWNNLEIIKNNFIFDNLDESKKFYFLHSYYFDADDDYLLSKTSYGHEFACLINNRNVYGIQCHPEKSHHNGVNLLKNFASFKC